MSSDSGNYRIEDALGALLESSHPITRTHGRTHGRTHSLRFDLSLQSVFVFVHNLHPRVTSHVAMSSFQILVYKTANYLIQLMPSLDR